ncbi:DNA-binding transcriptional regulator, LysR family [Micromonospora rhizosphaerae]|uniref:DNA-binding transcriptional regulator, LysR family n=1 Tax=Micromonospora rhizosphaerae TaxID=568872 RepID=A0A1C6SC12_9ACTN|nr:LysR family transcriptional regulator [Micromonospora rhizosphaerae]SCL26979.1 DNA-binding transcriptional regulator, LysR family [Micromonospora rhizosphaerae]
MNLANVDLNLLVALDALLTERNVTRAAARLGMTQPGMSNALGRLRRMLADPLLVRQGRNLSLTPQAEALLDPLAKILSLIQHTLEDRATFDPKKDSRSFTISASDYATLVLVGPLVRRLAVDAPGVTVHVFPRAPEAAQLLRSGEVDFVIEPKELMPAAEFPGLQLLGDRWSCAVWVDNVEVEKKMTMETYLRLPHVIYSIGRSLSLPDRYLQERNIRRRVESSVDSFLLAAFLLKGTSLTTLLPHRTRPYLQVASEIRMLEPPLELPEITEWLWWHPRHDLDPGHTWLRTRFAEVASDIRQGSRQSTR